MTSESENITLSRLNDQIAWYDGKSRRSQRWFKWLKATTIAAAALIALGDLTNVVPHAPAILGALIVVIEGIMQMNQYQQLWTSYRSTAETLKHEKYLFHAEAGPYATAEAPLKLLAERVESLVSQEHAKWVSAQETSGNK